MDQKKMKVSVMTGIEKMDFIERPIPKIQPNEALIKIGYVGICGSDLHYYEQGAIGDYVVEPPFVLGHEASGTVVEVGADVTHLKKGDRVALEPGKTCGHCEFCKTGRYNLCSDVIFFATPPVQGVFQEYVAHEAALCFKLPQNVGMLEGALVEPLAVGFHSAIEGGAHIGQTAVVFGAGCIGLTSMMALKAMSVSRVIVVDLVDARLDKALELGADHVINSAQEDLLDRIQSLAGNKGVDLVIDTAGAKATIEQSIQIVQKGATVVFVGYTPERLVEIPLNLALDKEITMKTIFRYRHIYPMAIQAVADGKVNLKDLATHVYDFEDIPKALDESLHKKDVVVKAAIKI